MTYCTINRTAAPCHLRRGRCPHRPARCCSGVLSPFRRAGCPHPAAKYPVRHRQTGVGADNSVRPFWKIPCLRARVTFGRCSKSDQKNSQKPRFLDFLHAVLITNLRPCTTRSQNMAVFVAYDVSPVLPAPLPLTLSTVEPKTLFGVSISGSGAGAETIPLTETKKEILRKRVAGSYNAVCTIARKEVKKPSVSSGSFGYFSSCWEK